MKTAGILIVSVALALSAYAAEEAEQKVALDAIPAPAAAAIKKLGGGAKPTKVSKETDEGKTVYEATFKQQGGNVREISVDAKGKLVSDEQTVPLAEVPAAARATIEAHSKGGKIEKIERVSEGGKITYEALVSANGKREEIVISKDGKVVKREDKSHEKKD